MAPGALSIFITILDLESEEEAKLTQQWRKRLVQGQKPTFRELCCSFPARACNRVDFPEPGGPNRRQMRFEGMIPLILSKI